MIFNDYEGHWYLISLPEINLPLIGSFTWITPPGHYRATTCRGRELNFGSHKYFLTTQGHGRSPLMSVQPNAGTTSETAQTWRTIPGTHSLIPTRRIWNDDYGGQIIFGDLVVLKVSDICLTGEENSEINLTQETYPDRGSNPGPLLDRRAGYRLFHSGGPVRLFTLEYIYISSSWVQSHKYIYMFYFVDLGKTSLSPWRPVLIYAGVRDFNANHGTRYTPGPLGWKKGVSFVVCSLLPQAEALTFCWPQIQGGP